MLHIHEGVGRCRVLQSYDTQNMSGLQDYNPTTNAVCKKTFLTLSVHQAAVGPPCSSSITHEVACTLNT